MFGFPEHPFQIFLLLGEVVLLDYAVVDIIDGDYFTLLGVEFLCVNRHVYSILVHIIQLDNGENLALLLDWNGLVLHQHFAIALEKLLLRQIGGSEVGNL